MRERRSHTATLSSAARLGPASSYANTYTPVSSPHGEGWVLKAPREAWGSLYANEGRSRLRADTAVSGRFPEGFAPHKTPREEHEAPLAVLIATPLQTWPVQVGGPSSPSRERNRELAPLHATLPLHRSFQQKGRGAFTRVNGHDWKLLDAPRDRGVNCILQCFRYSRRCKEHAVIIHAATRTLTAKPPCALPERGSPFLSPAGNRSRESIPVRSVF